MSDIEFKLAKNSLKLMAHLGIDKCRLIGGEPTLYPYLFYIIREGRKNNIIMVLVTNGRRLADFDYVNKLIDTGIARISISIQGASPSFLRDITGGIYSFKVSSVKKYFIRLYFKKDYLY